MRLPSASEGLSPVTVSILAGVTIGGVHRCSRVVPRSVGPGVVVSCVCTFGNRSIGPPVTTARQSRKALLQHDTSYGMGTKVSINPKDQP